MTWIDITTPLRHNMPTWPGDPACLIHQSVRMAQGAPCNLTHLNLSAHTATHMDAPRHFVADGKTMDQLPLDAVIGPCRILDLTHVSDQYGRQVWPAAAALSTTPVRQPAEDAR